MIDMLHIPLAQRKALCGRLLYLQATQPRKLEFVEAGNGAVCDFINLRNNLFHLTSMAILRSDDSVPLDKFLTNLLEDLERNAQSFLDGRHQELFSFLLRMVAEEASSICCHDCSPFRPTVCNGGDLDDQIVAEGGRCIASFHRMFNIAFEAARKYYSRYATSFASISLPDVVFSTGFSNKKPHDIPVDYFITGMTRYHIEKGSAVSQVQLDLCINKFDWDTYLATLYVLFHECISHIFHGIFPSPREREEPEPYDPFAEGWMDWIAYRVMEELISGRGPAAELCTSVSFPYEHLDIAKQFHLGRLNHEHQNKSIYATFRALGSMAAQKAYNLLNRLPESRVDPWGDLLGMTFDLNMALHRADERNKFVSLINKSLPYGNGRDNLRFLEGVTRITRNYLENRDIQTFIRSALSIS